MHNGIFLLPRRAEKNTKSKAQSRTELKTTYLRKEVWRLVSRRLISVSRFELIHGSGCARYTETKPQTRFRFLPLLRLPQRTSKPHLTRLLIIVRHIFGTASFRRTYVSARRAPIDGPPTMESENSACCDNSEIILSAARMAVPCQGESGAFQDNKYPSRVLSFLEQEDSRRAACEKYPILGKMRFRRGAARRSKLVFDAPPHATPRHATPVRSLTPWNHHIETD